MLTNYWDLGKVITAVSKKSIYTPQSAPNKNDGIKSKVFQFANNLTNIVNSTNKSVNSCEKHQDVICIDDSDSEAESFPICEIKDSDCFTVGRMQEDPECHIIEDDTDTVIINADGEESSIELDSSQIPPMKLEPLVVKIESLYREKIECLFDRTYISPEKNQESPSKEETCPKCNKVCDLANHVCSFECDLCSFIGKSKFTLALHKRHEHKIRKKNTKCHYGNKVMKIGSSKAHVQKTRVAHKPSHATKKVSRENQSETIISETTENTNVTEEARQHLNVAAKLDVFECDRCPFTTESRPDLTAHRQTVHNIRPGRKKKTGTLVLSASTERESNQEDVSLKESAVYEKQLNPITIEPTVIVPDKCFGNSGQSRRGHQHVENDDNVKSEHITDTNVDNTCLSEDFRPNDLEFHSVKDENVVYPVERETTTGPDIDPLSDFASMMTPPPYLMLPMMRMTTPMLHLAPPMMHVDHNKHGCPQCGKMYKQKGTLAFHLRYECGKEPQFPCEFCEYKAKRKTSLNSHIAFRHKEMINTKLFR